MQNQNYETIQTMNRVVIIASLLFCYFLGAVIKSYQWKTEAVKHNVAEYNQHTGKWQWKTNTMHQLEK